MLTITKNGVAKAMNDTSFKDEAIAILNEIIDSELNKLDDEICFELIEECCGAIIEIESNATITPSDLSKIFASFKFVKPAQHFNIKNLSNAMKIAIIAAALLVSTITVNAAVTGITGENMLQQFGIATTKQETTQTTEPTTQEAEITNKQGTTEAQASYTDDSILIKKANSEKAGKYVMVTISDGKDIDNPKITKKYTSYKKKGTAKIEREFTESISNKNTSFNEADYIERNCQNSVCNSETGELHHFTEWQTNEEPTCTQLGTSERLCEVCGKSQTHPIKATAKHKFTFCGADYANLKNSPYEFADGKAYYSCDKCGADTSRTIPKPMYYIIDNDVFEYDGKKHSPKIIAVLDREKNEIKSSEYTTYLLDSGSPGLSSRYQIVVDFSPSEFYKGEVGIPYSIAPDTVKLKGIQTGNGSIIPYWNKSGYGSYANGSYEIQYSTNENFKGAKKTTVKGISNTKNQISGLTTGETYYVRIRAKSDYVFGNEFLYGAWSDTRAITVK